MEKDIIKVVSVPLVCEECGEEIVAGSLINEFNGGGETMFYCMKCLPNFVDPDVEWKREDK
jgi:hypothetical protein